MSREEENLDIGGWMFIPDGWYEVNGEEGYFPAFYVRHFGPPVFGVTVNFNCDGSVDFIGPLALKRYISEAVEALKDRETLLAMLIVLGQRN